MNLYDETAALSALQGLPKVLDAHDPKGVVMNIQGGPEKGPYFVSHHKVVFYNFFPYFSGDVDSRPGRVFDNNMDLTGRYTTRQLIKIIEEYFTTKPVPLKQRQCRRDFGRNNISDRRTIQRLVANVGRQNVWQMPTKATMVDVVQP